MTWRPDPDPIAEQELDREEYGEYLAHRDHQPRASRTEHHRDHRPPATTWEPTEADIEAGREW